MRQFETGATRNDDTDQPDYEGFLSPLVIARYGEYMHRHRKQADGKLRTSDNWQKGISLTSYMRSGWRHFHDWWISHREGESREGLEEGICALLFNAMGYLHEVLKARGYKQCQEKQTSPYLVGLNPSITFGGLNGTISRDLPPEGTGCCTKGNGQS